ncbi:MAG: hypothetical protein A2252_01290 [Elusimicrobia bacterium RIFOXYA2_FULL_39_19]|nr:MAG: hypothetical protein A2252_01290 [Elusimicrobia bacterium RIFOXYA2_FULL_39_19]
MKIYFRLFYIIYSVLFFNAGLFAEELVRTAGISAVPFLKIGYTARAQGMAGNFTAISDDVSALEYNPAGLSNVQGSQYSFSQALIYGDISANTVLAVFSSGENALGFGITNLGISDFQRSVVNDVITEGTAISLRDTLVVLGYSHNMPYREDSRSIKIGVSVKYINEELNKNSASVAAFDAGLYYRNSRSGNTSGIVVQNIGSKIRGSLLPFTIRAGTGFMSKGYNSSFDIVQENDSKMKLGLGFEVSANKYIAFRFGGVYQQTSSLSAGFGLNFSPVKLDYAYIPHSDLGLSHRVTFQIDFLPKN